MSKKIRILQPATRQPARQIEPARLPDGLLYALFLTSIAPDGYPDGQWVCVTLPDLQIHKLPLTGYQPVWRLLSVLPQSQPGAIENLQSILSVPHKVMSADRMNRQAQD